MTPRALLLDAAGTLIEPAEPIGELYQRFFARHGFKATSRALEAAFLDTFASMPELDFDRFDDGHRAEHDWWRELVGIAARQVGIAPPPGSDGAFDRCFAELFDHYARGDAWRPFPELGEFLERAAGRGLRLAVVSNFDHRLHQVLDDHQLTSHFEFILTSGEARSRKPDGQIFHQALARLGLAPEQAFHIGDNPEADLKGARAAGIPVALVDRPDLTLLDLLADL